MNKTLDFSSGLLQQIFTAKEPRRTEEASAQRGNGHFLLITLVMMAAYFLTGKLTFEMSQNTLSHMVVSIVVFLPEGFALAGAILFGRSVWLGVFLGQLLLAVSAGMPSAPALGISAVNSMEAVLAASLVASFGLDKSLARVKDITGLMLLVALVLQPFSAFLGNSVLYAFSVVSSEDLVWSVFSWWFGNSVAQLLIAPMLVYLYVRRHELNIRNVSLVILFFVLLNYVLLYAMPVHRLALLLAITMPMVMLLAAYKGITYATIATTTIALQPFTPRGMGLVLSQVVRV